jgi:hypothetical protein
MGKFYIFNKIELKTSVSIILQEKHEAYSPRGWMATLQIYCKAFGETS